MSALIAVTAIYSRLLDIWLEIRIELAFRRLLYAESQAVKSKAACDQLTSLIMSRSQAQVRRLDIKRGTI